MDTWTEPMSNSGQDAGPPEFDPEDEIDELFGRANENPTRTGCPPHDVLIALAEKRVPIGDPAYEHLAKCSPCYREFRRLQQSGSASTPRFVIPRIAWIGVAAAVLAIVVTGAMWMVGALRRHEPPGGPIPERSVAAAEQQVHVDLRNYSVTRNDQQRQLEPVPLERGRLRLTILLSVGSEPGEYDVQLLDSSLRSRASARGQAVIKEFVTTLHTSIDLQSVSPGAYQLALRHSGDDWHLFPATVR